MKDNLFDRSFSARLAALAAVERSNAVAIEKSAEEIRLIADRYGKLHPGRELCAFSDALYCFAMGQRWIEATRAAEVEANRFRDACTLRAQEALAQRSDEILCGIEGVLRGLAELQEPSQLEELRVQALRIAMPFGMVGEEIILSGTVVGDTETVTKKRLEIAFIKFEINGRPAKDINTLRANVAYDIGIDLRVSRWPRDAKRLIISPISMEPEDSYDLPTFSVSPSTVADDEGPFVFHQVGRLRLKVAAALGARPFEFKYRGVFEPSKSEQALDILGHRTLRLESVDHGSGRVSGYTEIDERIFGIRNELRRVPGLPDSDLANSLEVCACLGNLAGQALSDALFPENTNEEAFQSEAVKALRRWPSIGEDLEQHPQIGGGICDLSYHRVRIELKSVPSGESSVDTIEKFADQTAQYVVSSGKRIGILCILDCKKKTSPPDPPASNMRIIMKQLGIASIPIIHLRIEGGLSRPSDLAR